MLFSLASNNKNLKAWRKTKMKRKSIIFWLFVGFFLVLFHPNVEAIQEDKELDKIENMLVTVDPCMEDASLDITYEITWKVLDSITGGPLTWVKIGTPNAKFTKPTALTDNIAKIKKYDGAYVAISFKEKYTTGESVTFKYSIHQPRVCTVTGDICEFEFRPAWFDYQRVDNLTVKWKADHVKESNSQSKEGDYLVWNRKNMEKGQKLTARITYEKKAFTKIKKGTDNRVKNKSANTWQRNMQYFIVCVIMIGGAAALFGGGGYLGGYYRHRGFYGGGHYRGGGCTCACACAGGGGGGCACAGSGRAGCSRKDFYGTNLTTKKLQKAMKS